MIIFTVPSMATDTDDYHAEIMERCPGGAYSECDTYSYCSQCRYEDTVLIANSAGEAVLDLVSLDTPGYALMDNVIRIKPDDSKWE